MKKCNFKSYIEKLNQALSLVSNDEIDKLYELLLDCKKNNRSLFFCGNGGSAGNANHLANDFIYGVTKKNWHRI